jgi:hypothetical protein
MHHMILKQFPSSKNPLLEKVVWADLLLANKSDSWTWQALHALQDFPASQHFLDAIQSRESINLKQFEHVSRQHIIGGWRELDNLTPHETHPASKIMRTYPDWSHTFWCTFRECSWLVGWPKRSHKPLLPFYLRLDISNNLSRTLSCLRVSGHNFMVQECVVTGIEDRRPCEELRICDKCDWQTSIVQDEEHILLRMNILSAFAHFTASLSSYLSM